MVSKNIVHIGLALSGGGSRGLAHIGVLKALEEAEVKPEVISGASMGAIIGALIAAGYSAEDLIRIATEKQSSKMFELNRPKLGLATHAPIRKILSEFLPETFEELQIPLYISTTNLNTGKNEIFSEGPLLDPVLASSSIPIVFKPIQINGDFYVDGGLTDNLPAGVIREKCNVLIGSHVNYLDDRKSLDSIRDIIEQCFRVAIYNTVRDERDQCDFYVDPPELRQFKTLDFKELNEIIQIGYNATLEELKEQPDVFNKGIMDRIKLILGNSATF